MCILLDGRVVTCPNLLFSKENEVLGSAFDEDLNEIWKKTDSKIMDQLGQKYCECCGKCDEYYTFNF